MRTKYITAAAAEGAAPRITISTDSVDSERDIIRQDGLTFRNPLPVLFGHDSRDLPVGMMTGVTRHGGRTEATWRWLENDDRATRVKNAFEQGALAASIGFRPIKAEPNQHGGWTIERAEVIEFSLVATPANADCVRILKGLALWDGAAKSDEDINLGAIPFDAGDDLSSDEIVTALREGFRQARREMSSDEVDISPAELRTVIREVLGATVATEVRSAINALTGRVD